MHWGALLVRSWALLVRSWSSFGTFCEPVRVEIVVFLQREAIFQNALLVPSWSALGHLGRSWFALWALLVALGALLGGLWAVSVALGALFGALFGRSWSLLVRSWVPFGATMTRMMAPVRKSEKKRENSASRCSQVRFAKKLCCFP